MNTNDLISRQEAINELNDLLGESWTEYDAAWHDGVSSAKVVIEALPSAEKTGRWEHEEGVYGIAFCSNCEFELRMNDTNICPNCGARMVGDKE